FPTLGRIEAIASAPPEAAEVLDGLELTRRAASAFLGFMHLLAQRTPAATEGSTETEGPLADRPRLPIVLFVDDLQWGDKDSALCFGQIMRAAEMMRTGVLFIGSHRTEDGEPSPVIAEFRRFTSIDVTEPDRDPNDRTTERAGDRTTERR